MKSHVDPAPGRVLADGLRGEAVGQGQQARAGSRETVKDRVARERGPRLTPAFVVGIEIAVVVVAVRRPYARVKRAGRVRDGEFLPVGDMPDMLGERPIRSSGVRGGSTRQMPRRVVEPRPAPGHPTPQGRLVGPQVALGGAQVARSDGRHGGTPEVCGLECRQLPPVRAAPPRSAGSVDGGTTDASSWSPSSTVRR